MLFTVNDQVFSVAIFINSKLKVKAEAGIGAGYTRAKRVWKLLVDRQYDCSVDEAPPPKERKPYFLCRISTHMMNIFQGPES
jgi:hypothetical protein